ncbi:hypothetical protein F5X98DRAFT_124301 [Xylaria grammica]|nr:hypothetical protein F5X98DRAFT_124301 [Xylaria grammica]
MATQRAHDPERLAEGTGIPIYNQESHLSSETSSADTVTPIDSQGETLENEHSHPSNEENCDAVSMTTTHPTDQQLPLSESLGYSGLIGVIGGSLWVLGIFAFLTFLWFGHGSNPEAADATSLWRFIALHNYFPQTITICSVALRVAVGIQATICTSMIAALLLEKYGAQKRDVAWLSIMRSLNGGPLKLGHLLLSKRPLAAFLRVESWLTFLLIAVTLALQFSSTLLLSDMDEFVVLGDQNNTEFRDLILFTTEDDLHGTSISQEFLTQPPVYATFGEVQAGFDTTPDDGGLSDTGLIQRSLLPISESDARVSVRKAEGTTVVMSSQSSCIRPRINAVYSPEYSSVFLNQTNQQAIGHIVGTVDYDESFRDAGVTPGSLCNDTGCGAVGFDCYVPSVGENAGWQTVTCGFDGVLGGSGPLNWDPVWDPADGPWSRNATIVLTITSNTVSRDWIGLADNITLPAGNPYEEWLSYERGSGHFFNITLCSLGFSLGRFHTSMASAGSLREPQVNVVRSTYNHSTADVQTFMGVAEPQGNHADRHIFDLEILGAPEDPPGDPASVIVDIGSFGNITVDRLTGASMESAMYLQFSPGFAPNMSLSLCYACNFMGYSVTPEISLLFSDTVSQTGRAASALLSLGTTVFTSVYYGYLGSLEISHAARVVATTVVRTPGPCSTNGCAGYITVSTLVLLHVICVVTITALYVAQVRYSRHDNVWHTIAQLGGDDLTDVLKGAHDTSDAVIERGLKMEHDNRPLKLSRQGTTGRVEVIRI